MKKMLLRVSMISGTLCGMSPLFLIMGIAAHDMQRFFHNWFVFVLSSLIVTLVSLVAMQLVDG